MTKNVTKDKDLGYKKILDELSKVKGSSVDIGILKGAKHPGQKLAKDFVGPVQPTRIEVAEIAIIHEFGSDKVGIPERSFLRTTFDKNKNKYRKVLRGLTGDIINNKISINQALSLFGERVVGDIKRKIVGLRNPHNATSTIKRKGFDNPLIATGTLLNRVKKRVNIKGKL